MMFIKAEASPGTGQDHLVNLRQIRVLLVSGNDVQYSLLGSTTRYTLSSHSITAEAALHRRYLVETTNLGRPLVDQYNPTPGATFAVPRNIRFVRNNSSGAVLNGRLITTFSIFGTDRIRVSMSDGHDSGNFDFAGIGVEEAQHRINMLVAFLRWGQGEILDGFNPVISV